MLGVRRMAGVQVDLFQGDPEMFVCDTLVRDATAIAAAFGRADRDGTRHLALAAPRTAQALDVMSLLRDLLQTRSAAMADKAMASRRGLGRVTVILSSLDHYYQFQDALFSLFPDEE